MLRLLGLLLDGSTASFDREKSLNGGDSVRIMRKIVPALSCGRMVRRRFMVEVAGLGADKV